MTDCDTLNNWKYLKDLPYQKGWKGLAGPGTRKLDNSAFSWRPLRFTTLLLERQRHFLFVIVQTSKDADSLPIHAPFTLTVVPVKPKRKSRAVWVLINKMTKLEYISWSKVRLNQLVQNLWGSAKALFNSLACSYTDWGRAHTESPAELSPVYFQINY